LRAGAIDFIEKPFMRETILDSIQRALDHEKERARDETSAREVMERASQLTERERQVLNHLVLGLSNKRIALRLGNSPRTVEVHRARVMKKMQARNLADLVRMALASKLDARLDP
jgi:two-component system, LuxR family, response regulator FixJ